MILALLLACAADKGEHTGHMGDDSSPPDDTHETADTDHGAAPLERQRRPGRRVQASIHDPTSR